VSLKRENPSWTPTPTMISENPRLPRWVPGGHPMNPLGVRALYLGSSAYRIHGTDAPWTIGTAASKGCIRLFNQDVLDLYPRVSVGAKVTVTYQTFTSNGTATAAAPANPIGTLTNSLPKVTIPNLFMYGDDDPPIPSRPMRARSNKGAAASKAAKLSKVAGKRAGSPVVVETAAAPRTPGP
jgi:pimeloyl-ACP methyl ester carboxylesterase